MNFGQAAYTAETAKDAHRPIRAFPADHFDKRWRVVASIASVRLAWTGCFPEGGLA